MANPSGTYGVSPSVVDLVGNTPLIRLWQIERDLDGVELYAKAEWKNPGGSVKDRPALRMIQEGLAARKLTPGKTILDATSGNTGIAYAMIGAAMDYHVQLCVPENVTPERKRILRAYGAELIFTDPRGIGWRDPRRPEAVRRESRPVLLRRSIQQRLQLARALRHHGARGLSADQCAPHALRGGPWHERDLHGHGAPPA